MRDRISPSPIGSLVAVNTVLQYRAARDFKVTILFRQFKKRYIYLH